MRRKQRNNAHKTVQIGYLSKYGGQCYINGQVVDLPPVKKKQFPTYKLLQVNNRVFANSYEYVNGKWKHTLRAFWYYIFG